MVALAGAPSLPAGVFPDQLVQDHLQLRGFDPALVQQALRDLEMSSLARDAVEGGPLWRSFGGVSGGGGGGT